MADPREVIHETQHATLPPVMGAILYQVLESDMVEPSRPIPGAGSITLPDPAPLRLPAWDLQALLPPDPFKPLVVDHLARRATEKGGDLPIAQSDVFSDQGNKAICKLFLVLPFPPDLALCQPVLAENGPSPVFRDWQSLPDVPDTRPAEAQ